MSFICSGCHTPYHGSPAVLVLERRPKEYVNYFKERTLTSHGHEIVKEAKFCPSCGKETPEAPVPVCPPSIEEKLQEEDYQQRSERYQY